MKTILGVDYSGVARSRPPDFAKMKKAGTEFAILRATYGITKDATFQRDWKKLKEAGIIRGAYMFPVMHRTRDPEPQVAAFVQAIEKAGGIEPGKDLPPVFDVEYSKGIKATGMTRMECLDWVHRAMSLLEDKLGVLPMLYTSARVWDGSDDDSLDADRVPVPALVDCPLWLARYPYKMRIAPHHLPQHRDGLKMPPVPRQLGDATDVWIHQYQGDAVGFPGYSASIDLNRFFPISKATAPVGAERVKWVQRKIRAKPDGIWGPKTEKALRDFQGSCCARGLFASRDWSPGVVDVATFCALSWA